MQNKFLYFIAVGLTFVSSATNLAFAEDKTDRIDYSVALAGLPLAKAQFSISLTDNQYRVDGELQSTGLANFIADTKAKLSASGVSDQDRWEPKHFLFQYKYGKRQRSFDTKFENGDVISAHIEPDPSKRHKKNWIPVEPTQLRSVLDPIAGLVVPTSSDPCRAQVKLFDGESRYDLFLTREKEDTFKTEGYDGQVIVCKLRYEPISGFRKKSRDVDYVRKLQNVEIRFAKMSNLNVYAPVHLTVPTKYGVLSIQATHFEG